MDVVNLSANSIKTGTLSSQSGNISISLDNNYISFNNRTLYISASGEIGAKGSLDGGGAGYNLYKGWSGSFDALRNIDELFGIITTRHYYRLWFCNGLCVGKSPQWTEWVWGDSSWLPSAWNP